MVESTGVVPKGFEDFWGQCCFDTLPKELDKTPDQSYIEFGLVFVIRVVQLLKPRGIAGDI